jgi:hypothetical protein
MSEGDRSTALSDDSKLEKFRALMGLFAVLLSDAAIIVATLWGVSHLTGSDRGTQTVAILGAAFTAVSTLTTAYLGIKAVSNTARSIARESKT